MWYRLLTRRLHLQEGHLVVIVIVAALTAAIIAFATTALPIAAAASSHTAALASLDLEHRAHGTVLGCSNGICLRRRNGSSEAGEGDEDGSGDVEEAHVCGS